MSDDELNELSIIPDKTKVTKKTPYSKPSLLAMNKLNPHTSGLCNFGSANYSCGIGGTANFCGAGNLAL